MTRPADMSEITFEAIRENVVTARWPDGFEAWLSASAETLGDPFARSTLGDLAEYTRSRWEEVQAGRAT